MARVFEKTLIVDGITPVGAYAVLRRDAAGGSFLLESVVPGERWGRYSILGYRPRSQVVRTRGSRGVSPSASWRASLPAVVEPEASVAARFARAHVGVVPYDAVHYTTKVDPWPELQGKPVARFVSDATVVVFDNLTHTATLASTDPAELERAERDLARARGAVCRCCRQSPAALPDDLDVSVSDADYEARRRARQGVHLRWRRLPDRRGAHLLHAGRRGGSLRRVSRAARAVAGSVHVPAGAARRRATGGAVAVAGASPETLVRVEGSRITLRPIAGTRRRGSHARGRRSAGQRRCWRIRKRLRST